MKTAADIQNDLVTASTAAYESIRRLEVVVEAARALYEEVQMAESVGVCLPDRANTLILGEALRVLDGQP